MTAHTVPPVTNDRPIQAWRSSATDFDARVTDPDGVLVQVTTPGRSEKVTEQAASDVVQRYVRDKAQLLVAMDSQGREVFSRVTRRRAPCGWRGRCGVMRARFSRFLQAV